MRESSRGNSEESLCFIFMGLLLGQSNLRWGRAFTMSTVWTETLMTESRRSRIYRGLWCSLDQSQTRFENSLVWKVSGSVNDLLALARKLSMAVCQWQHPRHSICTGWPSSRRIQCGPPDRCRDPFLRSLFGRGILPTATPFRGCYIVGPSGTKVSSVVRNPFLFVFRSVLSVGFPVKCRGWS